MNKKITKDKRRQKEIEKWRVCFCGDVKVYSFQEEERKQKWRK